MQVAIVLHKICDSSPPLHDRFVPGCKSGTGRRETLREARIAVIAIAAVLALGPLPFCCGWCS